MLGLLAGIAGATAAAIIAVVQCTRQLMTLFSSSAPTVQTNTSGTSSFFPAQSDPSSGNAAYSVFTATTPDPLALTFLTFGHLLILCAVLVPAIMVVRRCVQARRGALDRAEFPLLVIRSGLAILVLGGTGAVLIGALAGAFSTLPTTGFNGATEPTPFPGFSPAPFLIGAILIGIGVAVRALHKTSNKASESH